MNNKVKKRMKTLPIVSALALCCFLSGFSLNALCQSANYPSKPIRLLIPFAPAGGADVTVRPIIQKLSDILGQSIIYENRGGAGGILAGDLVAKAIPDGYTLLLGAVSVMTVSVNLMKKPPFDPVNDFSAITKIADVPSLLAANTTFAPRTVKQIVEYAQSNPGKLVWGVSGMGSAGHLAMERFRLDQKLNVIQILYKGAGPGTLALLSNETQIMYGNPGVFLPHIKSGRLRAVATASSQRMNLMPDLPTFGEMGYAGYENGSWYGLIAPAHTSKKIINQLYSTTNKILHDPDILSHLQREGAIASGNTPEQFSQEIKREFLLAGKIIKAADIHL
jgi:tripartite-type tricarboxylate transporter receptor subunit TctC